MRGDPMAPELSITSFLTFAVLTGSSADEEYYSVIVRKESFFPYRMLQTSTAVTTTFFLVFFVTILLTVCPTRMWKLARPSVGSTYAVLANERLYVFGSAEDGNQNKSSAFPAA